MVCGTGAGTGSGAGEGIGSGTGEGIGSGTGEGNGSGLGNGSGIGLGAGSGTVGSGMVGGLTIEYPNELLDIPNLERKLGRKHLSREMQELRFR
jgi:hypothetical protein